MTNKPAIYVIQENHRDREVCYTTTDKREADRLGALKTPGGHSQYNVFRMEDEPFLETKPETVSVAWLLSALAGMSFPNQGQAYDYVKRLLAL